MTEDLDFIDFQFYRIVSDLSELDQNL